MCIPIETPLWSLNIYWRMTVSKWSEQSHSAKSWENKFTSLFHLSFLLASCSFQQWRVVKCPTSITRVKTLDHVHTLQFVLLVFQSFTFDGSLLSTELAELCVNVVTFLPRNILSLVYFRIITLAKEAMKHYENTSFHIKLYYWQIGLNNQIWQ